MRTTVTIDDDGYKAAQGLASASGKRLGGVLSELARRGLKGQAQPAARNGWDQERIGVNELQEDRRGAKALAWGARCSIEASGGGQPV
jgi:hypothetical protein